MKIVFKNGKELSVPIEIATIIREAIINPQGAKKFQCFSDENDKLLHIINVEEIVYITEVYEH